MPNPSAHSQSAMPTRQLILAALFCALLAIFSQIMIPLPLVPINLALLAVYLCAALLPLPYAVAAIGAYLLLGFVGVPVFAGLKGGPDVLLGMRGGFLFGYLLAALAIGLLKERWQHTLAGRAGMFAIGLALCLGLGIIWFMKVTGHPLSVSLGYCVWPFLPGDAVKIALAAALVPRLQKALAARR